MNIVVATPYLPYPDVPHGGGQDLFALIRFLGRRHMVRVVSFTDAAQAVHAGSLRPFIADLYLVWPAVTVKQKLSSAAAAARRGEWRSWGRRAGREVRETIAAWSADADVLICAWTEMGRYLAATPPRVVRVLDEVDVRFLVDEFAARRRWWLRPQARRRRCEELAYCRSAHLVAARSARDLEALRRELPDLRGLVLPPVAHVAEYAGIRPEASEPGRVLFVGAMDRARNQAAAGWLVQAIWPAVRAAYPAAVLRIVGAHPPPEICALGRAPGVQVMGWVDDLRAEYARARVVVAPMRSEAGALNKVIDGLAAGRPVVATAAANAGVGAPPEAIRLADDAGSFARHVVRLLDDADEWARVGQAGRRHALREFDWAAAAGRLEAELEALRQRIE
jgi:glycosyltransferase involved in cell wall biosynthesis